MGLLMFETSLVESSGKLRSKSGHYLWITASFNVAIVAVMILIPLLYPDALPRAVLASMVSAPLPPRAQAPPRTVASRPVRTVASLDPYTAPTRVPTRIDTTRDDPPPSVLMTGIGTMDATGPGSFSPIGSIGAGNPLPAVRPTPPKPTVPAHISSGVIAGNKLSGADPVYPPIARATRVSGAVVLHAMISKAGLIESLSVVSGPEMLRANAVSAVQGWRYRPYLLNGEPTEVETTITVNFSIGG